MTAVIEAPEFGAVVAEKTLEKRGAKVVVTEYEDGFTIVGGSTIWWLSDGVTPWGKFTAEINRCGHLDGDPNAPVQAVCTVMHVGRECKGKCHELGHINRILGFAERVLRSY